MRVTRHYVVAGRVQGVGFRWFVVDAATREGLGGWVRNRADGLVEVVADGDAESLGRFEAALWQGPSRARVEDVQVSDSEPLGAVDGFSIR